DTMVGALADVMAHPGTFGLAGAGITVGRNGGSAVSSRYKSPFAFTGGTIARVTVDLSGRPYEDLEKELALAFSRDLVSVEVCLGCAGGGRPGGDRCAVGMRQDHRRGSCLDR